MITSVVAYAGLFAVAFLAATILPLQSEAVLALLLAQGAHPWAALLAVATVGNTLGAVVNWGLGRWLTHYAGRRWFPVREAQLQRAAGWYARYGRWCLLLSWLPVVGDALTVAAGVLRERLWLFVVLVGIGKAARYGVVAAGVYGLL